MEVRLFYRIELINHIKNPNYPEMWILYFIYGTVHSLNTMLGPEANIQQSLNENYGILGNIPTRAAFLCLCGKLCRLHLRKHTPSFQSSAGSNIYTPLWLMTRPKLTSLHPCSLNAGVASSCSVTLKLLCCISDFLLALHAVSLTI